MLYIQDWLIPIDNSKSESATNAVWYAKLNNKKLAFVNREDKVRYAMESSVYKMAYFIAYNWWNIFYEPYSEEEEYEERTQLNECDSSIYVPDIRFKVEGDFISVTVKPDLEFDVYNYKCLDYQTQMFTRDELMALLLDFVNSVGKRLSEKGITGDKIFKYLRYLNEATADDIDYYVKMAKKGEHAYSEY